MKTKICSKCGINKPLEDYNLEPRMSDGRRSNCKVCKAKTDKSYKAKNQEKVNIMWLMQKRPKNLPINGKHLTQ